MAWSEWQRTRRKQARRLLTAMIGLTAVRISYIIVAIIALSGWGSSQVLLPPLERFADTASIAILGWAFVPPARRGVRAWDVVFGANLVLAAGACVGLTILWAQALAVNPVADYSSSWQSSAWTVWQMGLLFLNGFVALRYRRPGWDFFAVAMFIMFLGRPMQMVLLAPVPHLPIWERLANLVAYPLVTVAVYQSIVTDLRVQGRQLEGVRRASLDQVKSLLVLLEASLQMSSSLSLSTVLDNAVRGVARVMDADQCAIALLEEDEPGLMRLAAVYNPARPGRGEAVTFPLEYQLAIQQALRRKRHVVVRRSDNIQLKVLFSLLGSSETGPLLVQPMLSEGRTIGTILVGNSRSRRRFTPNEAKLCQCLADQVVAAMLNARRYQSAQIRIKDLHKSLEEERRVSQHATAQVRGLPQQSLGADTGEEDIGQRQETALDPDDALEVEFVSRPVTEDAMRERVPMLETELA
jgi:GAF domain-containing protein